MPFSRIKTELKQCVVFAAAAFAMSSVWAGGALPVPVQRAIQSVGLSESEVAIWIAPTDGETPRLAHQPTRTMTPASIVKTVTTLAGLELLGPDYAWETLVSSAAPPDKDGRVSFVAFHGSGDPHFVAERIWLAAERLRAVGVKAIDGDITIDRTAFSVPDEPPEGFDGKRGRTYNVPPDAAMVNLRTVCLEIDPKPELGVAQVVALPLLKGFEVQKTLPLASGACYDWKTKMGAKMSTQEIQFHGAYPKACGKKLWPVAIWKADEYFTAAFAHAFSEVGIQWNGSASGTDQKRVGGWELLRMKSEPLSAMVGYINKFSNNPMARHLFLTLSYADGRGRAIPASLERSRRVLAQWLDSIGVDSKSVFIDNGSGLSRETHLDARALGTLLQHGAKSPFASEFRASLPIAGVDGTMKKRKLPRGWAHIKTGRVTGVRSAAGYVRDVNGKDWVVVVIVNAQHDEHTEDAIDRILAWVGEGTP